MTASAWLQASLFGDEQTADVPALSVSDAISDMPEAALLPKDTQKAIPYAREAATPYQRAMREGSETLTHHSAKRMLGIRRLRLALLHPGDYGTSIEERLANGGLPDSVINSMMGGDADNMRDIEECRTEDRKKELALRELLRSGHTSIEQIMTFLDSQGFANKYRRLRWDRPSHTLVAHMARDCSDFVHPSIDRFVSVREAARLGARPAEPSRICGCASEFPPPQGAGPALLEIAGINSDNPANALHARSICNPATSLEGSRLVARVSQLLGELGDFGQGQLQLALQRVDPATLANHQLAHFGRRHLGLRPRRLGEERCEAVGAARVLTVIAPLGLVLTDRDLSHRFAPLDRRGRSSASVSVEIRLENFGAYSVLARER